MAKEPKFNCIEEFIKKNKKQKFYEFPNEKDNRSYAVIWKDDVKRFWSFFPDFVWTSTVNGVRIEKGSWKCNGNAGFTVISDFGKIWSTTDPSWKPYEDGSDDSNSAEPEIDNSVFDCILKNKNLQGNVATVDPTGKFASFLVDETDKIYHIFYKDNKWTQTKKGFSISSFDVTPDVNQFTGKWNCDGDHHFLIFTDDESYSSRSDNWETIDSDTFPLRYGSKGPNVVKLQKFLNSKLPNNPLTVNGIFDTQTENKLIEYQRKEGLI
jgi:hypothetical protein